MPNLDLATVKIKITADNSEAVKGLEEVSQASSKTGEDVNKKWSETGKQLAIVGTAMTAAITVPLTKAFTAAVQYASDLTETMGKTEVVFKDNADSVVSWSENSVNSMGIAQETALSMASSYGDMATSMGLTTQQSSQMSMSLTQLAADLASFKNISVETAASSLEAVFTGQSQSLVKLGIVMNETTLSAFAMSQGITKTYKEMSQAEKVQLRYRYVMAQTANAQGDFARTGDSLANQQRKLSENTKQLSTSIGSILEPVITRIVGALNSAVSWFNNLSQSAKTVITVIGLVAAALGPVLVMIGTLGPAIAGIVSTLSAVAAPVLGIAAALGVVTTALLAASRGAAEAKQLHQEAAKELGKDLAANYIQNDITNIEIKDNATENEKAKQAAIDRLNAIKETAITNGSVIQNSLGAITFPIQPETGIKGFTSAVMSAVNALPGYKKQISDITTEISSYWEQQTTALSETYAQLEMSYVIWATAAGMPVEAISQTIGALHGEFTALAERLKMSEEDSKRLTAILANGITDDDIPALQELIGKYPELIDNIHLTDEQLIAMMANFQEQPEAAAAAYEMLMGRVLQDNAAMETSAQSYFTTYSEKSELARNAQEGFLALIDANIDKQRALATGLEYYHDGLQQGMTASEAWAFATQGMYDTMGEDASQYFDLLAQSIEDTEGLQGNFDKNMIEAAKSARAEIEVAERAKNEAINKSMKKWSADTIAVYDAYMSELLGITVEGGDTQTALQSELFNGLSALREQYQNGDRQAVLDYLTATGADMSDANVAKLMNNEQFWADYEAMTANGAELSKEQIAQLAADMGMEDEFGAAGTTDAEAFNAAEQEAMEGVDSEAIQEAATAGVEGVNTAFTEEGSKSGAAFGDGFETGFTTEGVEAASEEVVTVLDGTATGAGQAGTQAGQEYTNNAQTAITSGTPSVTQAAQAQATGLEGVKPYVKRAAVSNFTEYGNGAIETIKTGTPKITAQAQTSIQAASSSAQPVAKTGGSEVGAQFVNGAISGFASREGTLLAKARDLANRIKQVMKDAWEIHSPSKVAEREIGLPIIQGIEIGLENEYTSLASKLNGMMDNIISGGTVRGEQQLQRNIATTATTNNNNNGNTTINQTNNFTARVLTPYEQQEQVRKMNRQLAEAFA